jgi:D-aspartate ligase
VTAAPRPPAVLLGGNENAVSVARSLAASGVSVTALGERDAQVRFSRACHVFATGRGEGEPQARWLAWLEQGGAPGAVVLACSDDGLELIARNRSDLDTLGYHPMELNPDAALAILDKRRTHELAERAGIPTPAYAVPANETELELVAAAVAYPCCVKPLVSHVFRRRAPGRGKLLVVANPEELTRVWRELAALGVETMVTELVPGGDETNFMYHAYTEPDGGVLFELLEHKLRQHPPVFGDGCYRIAEWDDEIAALGLRFLHEARAYGVAEVELKRDPRDGTVRLIECNYRFSSANELPRVAGADPGLIAYHRALGEPPPPPGGRRDGVRLWHPADDFLTFVAYRRRGELTAAAWVRSLLHRQYVPVFRWSDPLPTVAYHLLRAYRLARKPFHRAPQ